MTLSFTPIVSTGGTMTLEGKVGDQNYANMVYVDLSNNSQMQIDRKSWNLGFYCGDEFRVVLNSSYATVAAASEKTDFAAVTLEDAQSAPNIAAGSMSEDFKAEWIDDVTGDLSKTHSAKYRLRMRTTRYFSWPRPTTRPIPTVRKTGASGTK